jgi:RNA polymerase sigma-70 factor (ECF subfamily)
VVQPDDETERRLVVEARHDADAFGQLYRTHVDAIYRFLLRRSRSQEVAEEVTSATFERALRGLDSFHWRPGGFRGWLHRIAANELAEHYRGLQRAASPQAQRTLRRYAVGPGDGESDAMLDAIDDLDQLAADLERLAAALNRLSPGHQEVISVRYLAGLDVAEAADALGCTRGTLAVRSHRALSALRQELERRRVSDER